MIVFQLILSDEGISLEFEEKQNVDILTQNGSIGKYECLSSRSISSIVYGIERSQ